MVAKLTMARERILIDDWQNTLATAERADRQNQLTRKLTTVTAKGQHHNPPLLAQLWARVHVATNGRMTASPELQTVPTMAHLMTPRVGVRLNARQVGVKYLREIPELPQNAGSL